MPERRALKFASIDEILPDVERLLEGHVTVGKWTLGMMCNHLAATIRHSVEGFPFGLPWVVRRTVGPLAYRYLDRRGSMPAGVRVPRELEPAPGLDARAEAESLREALALFRGREPIREHPLFGRFDRARWERIHGIHAAHHLSFALPTGPEG